MRILFIEMFQGRHYIDFFWVNFPGFFLSSLQRAVELLLKHSAEINTQDKFWHTPLHMAAANWATGCAESLILHVCSVDVYDRSGRTPLHHAAHSGHGELRHSRVSACLLLIRGLWSKSTIPVSNCKAVAFFL